MLPEAVLRGEGFQIAEDLCSRFYLSNFMMSRDELMHKGAKGESRTTAHGL